MMPNGPPVEAAVARAAAAMREGRAAEATLLLRQLIATTADPDPIRLTLANHLRTSGEPAEALAELDRLVGPTRAGLPARTTRATLLVKLGRHEEALPIFERNALELPQQQRRLGGPALAHGGRRARDRRLDRWAVGRHRVNPEPRPSARARRRTLPSSGPASARNVASNRRRRG